MTEQDGNDLQKLKTEFEGVQLEWRLHEPLRKLFALAQSQAVRLAVAEGMRAKAEYLLQVCPREPIERIEWTDAQWIEEGKRIIAK